MNCTELFFDRVSEAPERCALWLPRRGLTSFAELEEMASRARVLCRFQGLQRGETVLVFDDLGPRLYAVVVAILSLGATVVLVEPWMPVRSINRVLEAVKPKMFLSSLVGCMWGLRLAAVRRIPTWLPMGKISRVEKKPISIESVDPATPAIITFTSGTTGNPKGVVRGHGYLVDQHRVLSEALELENYSGTDLCIFANFVMMNLASGRGTVIVPPNWRTSVLKGLHRLPDALRPRTLTCGPGFLIRLMRYSELSSLESIHVGGALSDRALLEAGFRRWPRARWTHVYGSSEAEPVSTTDARVAVSMSRERGYFQTLYVGRPVPQIRSQLEADTLWVAGPHVCPRYIGNDEENRKNKRTDAEGTLWHRMGDRIRSGRGGWWYSGRSQQSLEQFELEQSLYAFLGSSAAFVHTDDKKQNYLLGEHVTERAAEITRKFREIRKVVDVKIVRDRRHRARIDRPRTLEKGAPWLAG